jgi:hypothetical protein
MTIRFVRLALVALLVTAPLTACGDKQQCSGDGPTYRTRRAGHSVVHERCIDHQWKQVS